MPIEGHAGFISGAQNLLFGEDSIPLKEGRIASVQSLSGTGALRIGFEFLKQYLPSTMYISNPTWANHPGMLDRCRIKYVEYPYYNPETKSVDIKGMISALEKAEPRSIILLHACAHNPTGVDPTENQWKQISEVMKKNSLFPFFDSAYQGFASGDIDKDAWAIRYFMSQGFQMFVAQSFAKNMGLYGERIGAFHAVCATKDTKERVLSQIKPIVRTNYSNPPLHGARIADKILNNKTNLQIWKKELKEVAHRVIEMRTVLRKRLEEMKTPGIYTLSNLGTWHHITDQIGMFSYTGLTESQCDILIKKYHVYLLRSGRVSMAGVNSKNVGYLADAIKNSIEEAK
jgi:aspartate aminotransferase